MSKHFFLHLFTYFFVAISLPIHASNYYLVACAIFQNEAFFLKEWIEYHKLIGIEHFYLYNNQSTDDYLEILQPYIKEGLVDLFEWDVKTNSQVEYLELLQKPAYEQALNLVKDKATWAAFIDLDEFLVPMHHQNLQALLKDYEAFGGVAINWQLFGTSGIDHLPENGLLIENLTWKADPLRPLNQFIKYIVQPKKVVSVYDPHDFEFQEGFFAVNSNKCPLPMHSRGQSVVLDTICINHYWFGTLDWFLNHKIPRREKWGFHIAQDYLDEIIAKHNEVEDRAIQRFVPFLKQAIKGVFP